MDLKDIVRRRPPGLLLLALAGCGGGRSAPPATAPAPAAGRGMTAPEARVMAVPQLLGFE
jgi:hypothetical protein